MWMVCEGVRMRSCLWACACGEMHDGCDEIDELDDAGHDHLHPLHHLMTSSLLQLLAARRWLVVKLRGVAWSVCVCVNSVYLFFVSTPHRPCHQRSPPPPTVVCRGEYLTI